MTASGSPTARTLVLLRHAKAAPAEDYPSDIDRPLARRGRAAAAVAGRWLAEAGLRPDLVLCSPAVRTRETLQAAGLEQTPTRYEQALYPGDAEEMLALVQATEAAVGTLLVIGHNPAMSYLSALLGTPEAPGEELRTAGIAVHSLEGAWSDCEPHTAPLIGQHTARG